MTESPSACENVRMSAHLKVGGRTDDRPDERPGPESALTSGWPERPDETSAQTSAQLLISPDEWPARLDALVAGARRRKAERDQLRQDLATRRTAGLKRRHAAKLARPQPTPEDDDDAA